MVANVFTQTFGDGSNFDVSSISSWDVIDMMQEKDLTLVLQTHISVKQRMAIAKGQTTGFDYLRIVLSVGVLVWHSIWYSGSVKINDLVLASKFRFIVTILLPLFFALSGFLVAGSLMRTRLYQFVILRLIRLVPALAVEVTLSAVILGPIFTRYSLPRYFTEPMFFTYFGNIVGLIHYTLPGVFEGNPGGPYINAQLWTIPFELYCYTSLIGLSILTVVRRKTFYLALIIGGCMALTVWPVAHNPQGTQLVLSFLVASSFYLHRESIPYSNFLGWVSLLMTAVLLLTPSCTYLVPFTAAYTVIWIGLMSPPAIPFGDLSYGIFLFHLPIEQTIIRISPWVMSWWILAFLTFPAVFGVALLSWTFVEKPILSRKKFILSKADATVSAVCKLPPALRSPRSAKSAAFGEDPAQMIKKQD